MSRIKKDYKRAIQGEALLKVDKERLKEGLRQKEALLIALRQELEAQFAEKGTSSRSPGRAATPRSRRCACS
mgnify:CR=1 FL=1